MKTMKTRDPRLLLTATGFVLAGMALAVGATPAADVKRASTPAAALLAQAGTTDRQGATAGSGDRTDPVRVPGAGNTTGQAGSQPSAERMSSGQQSGDRMSAGQQSGDRMSGDQRADRQMASGGAQDFVKQAALGGMTEVQASQIATDATKDRQIKQFALMMIEDHMNANEKLAQIARDKGLQVPAQLDQDHRQRVEKLRGLSGARFDGQYMTMMVADHQKTVSLFEDQAENGQDAEIREFAATTLPTLRMHLVRAEQIHADLEE